MQGHPGSDGVQMPGDLRTDTPGTTCHQHDRSNGVSVHLSQKEFNGKEGNDTVPEPGRGARRDG